MQGLTKRQREIVDFIEGYVSEKRHSPSYRDIQQHFEFSSLGSVYNHIQSLKKKGIVSENTQNSRSLTLLTEQKMEGIEIPLIGQLRGGMPIETYPQISKVLLPSLMVHATQACYLLKAVGSELEEEWIKQDDLLLIQSKSDFEDEEMVLAQVSRQTTFIKRAFRDSPYIRLESVNPEVEPLILREEHVQILGIILSLIRDYR
jgi:repressor LexA